MSSVNCSIRDEKGQNEPKKSQLQVAGHVLFWTDIGGTTNWLDAIGFYFRCVFWMFYLQQVWPATLTLLWRKQGGCLTGCIVWRTCRIASPSLRPWTRCARACWPMTVSCQWLLRIWGQHLFRFQSSGRNGSPGNWTTSSPPPARPPPARPRPPPPPPPLFFLSSFSFCVKLNTHNRKNIKGRTLSVFHITGWLLWFFSSLFGAINRRIMVKTNITAPL